MIEIRHKETGEVLHRVAADSLEGARLTHARLREADLRDANLRGVDFRGADLREADLRGAILTGANFDSPCLSCFFSTDLASCDGIALCAAMAIIAAIWMGIAAGAPIWVIGAAFLLGLCALLPAWLGVRTRLDGADLRGAILTSARLRGTFLTSADLRDADLDRTVLMQSTLVGSDLRGANLTDAQFLGTFLIGADLRNAKLGAPNLRGILCDAATRWPDGFAPEAHGAKPIQRVVQWRKATRERATEVSPAAPYKGRGHEPSATSHGSEEL